MKERNSGRVEGSQFKKKKKYGKEWKGRKEGRRRLHEKKDEMKENAMKKFK